MDELKDEIRRLREEVQSLITDLDNIKGDIAENTNLLKRVFNLLVNRR